MSCPEGLVPNVEYLTCERDEEWSHRGIWTHPTDGPASNWTHPAEIVCEKLLCEDLNENFFDETVDVSVF